MDVRNARRETLRGRAAIVFDFIGAQGREDPRPGRGRLKEARRRRCGWTRPDPEVAHLESPVYRQFSASQAGWWASIDKGSSFRFDQSLVNGESGCLPLPKPAFRPACWLFKGYRQHFNESDYDFKRSTWRPNR